MYQIIEDSVEFVMDLLTQLKIATMPRFVKAALAFMLVSMFFFNVAIVIAGARDASRAGWIEAGASLMAALLPVLALSAIVLFRDSGIESLEKRTRWYLNSFLPERLGTSIETDIAAREAVVHKVTESHRPLGDYSTEYCVRSVVDETCRELKFVLELKTYRMNLILLFPESNVQSSDLADCFDEIRAGLRATIDGAVQEGFELSAGLISDMRASTCYLRLTLRRELVRDFLWDPVEQLYVAQDIGVMLKAALFEDEHLFVAP